MNMKLSLAEFMQNSEKLKILISRALLEGQNKALYGKCYEKESLIQLLSTEKLFKGVLLQEIAYISDAIITIDGLKISLKNKKPEIIENALGIDVEIGIFDISKYAIRNLGLILSEKAANKKALLVGFGSVGSRIAEALVKHGVITNICDFDSFEIHNGYRWGIITQPELSVGRSKVLLAKEIFENTIPNAKVTAYHKDFSKEFGFFEELVKKEKFELIIVSTDTLNSHRDAMILAYRNKIPILYCLLGDKAETGMIAYYSPDMDCCHLCFSAFEGAEEINQNLRSDNRQYGIDSENEQHGVPALSVDISIISSIASKIALAIISGEDASEYFTVFGAQGNIIFFSTKPEAWILESAFQKICVSVRNNKECVLCGKPVLKKEKHIRMQKRINEIRAKDDDPFLKKIKEMSKV